MAVNQDKDKAVVIVNRNGLNLAFGFPHLYSAVGFIERQVVKPQLALEAIQEAVNGGTLIDDVMYEIQDIDTYLDNVEEDGDNDDEE